MSKNIIVAAVVAVMLCACGNAGKDAMRLVEESETLYAGKKYDEALGLIDSLRRTYPEAVEARKKALSLYQKIELERTQADLAVTDSVLRRAIAGFHALDSVVAEHKAAGTADAGELTALTRMRMRRDSLQARFDVQCAKIRYIRQKMEE